MSSAMVVETGTPQPEQYGTSHHYQETMMHTIYAAPEHPRVDHFSSYLVPSIRLRAEGYLDQCVGFMQLPTHLNRPHH